MALIGCGPQSARNHFDCYDEKGEPNKIVHIAFVQRGTTVDTTSATTIKNTILAAELAGTAYIIRNVSGTKAAPSIKEAKGAGLQSTRMVGKEHTITFIDFQYIDNIAFWNDFEYNASNFDLYYWTTNRIWKTDRKTISAAVSDGITDDINTDIEASITVKWSQKSNPVAYLSQAIDFASAQQISFTSLTAGPGTNEATIAGTSLTLAGANDDLSVQINFNPVATTYELEEDSVLPTGITLSSAGVLSGNITTNGTYTFSVVGKTATGVAGITPVTITVS